MQKLQDFLKNYHRTRAVIFAAACFGVAAIFFFAGYYLSHSTMRPMNPAGLLPADTTYVFAVEEAAPFRGDYFKLSGWALRQGEDVSAPDTHFLLLSEADGQCYRLPTAAVTRADVDLTVDPEGQYDYELCGIESVIKRSLLQGDYRVMIACLGNGANALIDTGVTVNAEGVVADE